MATQEIITLFLASPGDVNPERAIVRKIVDECNDSIGKSHGIRVEVNGWETNARPAWGKDGQAIINEQIANMKNHTLFVGIMWNRFGTKTPRAASGTREEYDLAVAARRSTRGKRPEIMFYFGTAPFTPKSKADNAQKDLVFDFKAEIEKKKKGLYWTFNGPAEFETLFRKHYSDWLNSYIAARRAALKPRATAVKTLATPGIKLKPTPRKATVARSKAPIHKRILLGGDVFVVEDVREIGTNWTMTVRPKTPVEDKKIRELLNKYPHSFGSFALAYQLQAGKANINKAGERGSDDKGDYWKLDLRFIPARGASNVYYQGMSANETAEQKANWLLLAQEPILPTPRNSWGSPSNHLLEHIKGHGAAAPPILPALWKRVGGDRARFAAMASLVAVERLLNSEVCEHIEELKIGAVNRGKVTVKFRATRQDETGGAFNISVEGDCVLAMAD